VNYFLHSRDLDLTSRGRFLKLLLLLLCWALAASSVAESYTQSVGPMEREMSTSQGFNLHKQNERTQTLMPRLGFEPTTLAVGRAKTSHASDRTVTMIS
jgi:hypothetical protein